MKILRNRTPLSLLEFVLLLYAGLDCKFLQGDATDMSKVRAFMRDLMTTGGRANLDILNYNKDNTLSHNISYCMPIVDDCGHAVRYIMRKSVVLIVV